jgi:hypothetical protein
VDVFVGLLSVSGVVCSRTLLGCSKDQSLRNVSSLTSSEPFSSDEHNLVAEGYWAFDSPLVLDGIAGGVVGAVVGGTRITRGIGRVWRSEHRGNGGRSSVWCRQEWGGSDEAYGHGGGVLRDCGVSMNISERKQKGKLTGSSLCGRCHERLVWSLGGASSGSPARWGWGGVQHVGDRGGRYPLGMWYVTDLL